jgi:RNA polymerase-binding transcription factor DksA
MTGRTRTVRTAAPRGITDHLPDLRSALEQQRQFRVDQLDELAAAAADTTTAADLPRIQVAAAVRTAAATALADIDAALHRLEHGTYGTCEPCHAAIPLERLEILPMSRLCMRCQHAIETGRSTTTRETGTVGGSATRRHVTHVTHRGDSRRLTPNRRAQRRPMQLETGGAVP